MSFFNMVGDVFTLIMLPFSLLISLLPVKYQTTLKFKRDYNASLFRLAFGRLYPRLEVPHIDLSDKTAIITGGNSGIGLQIGIDLARMGADVILACRNPEKAQAAVETIIAQVPKSKGKVRASQLDTSSLKSVRDFAATWPDQPDHTSGTKTIDILIHNAGIATAPKDHPFTAEGMEAIYATNLLGSFLMTHLLEQYLKPTARVVFTSSTGQYTKKLPHFTSDFAPSSTPNTLEPGFHCPCGPPRSSGPPRTETNPSARYSNTKSMQCALAILLQKRWDRDRARTMSMQEPLNGHISTSTHVVRGRTAHSFTPNFAATPIFDKIEMKSAREDPLWAILRATTVFAIDIDQGAATGSWLASTDDERVVGLGNGGGYYDRMTRTMCDADLYSEELLGRLWGRWEKDAGVVWR